METVYRIRNTDGVIVARHIRVDLPDGKKSMFWEQPNGRPGLGGLTSLELPLYGSEISKTISPGQPVLLVEGEKATRALWEHDIPAFGTVVGASSTHIPTVLAFLKRFWVTTWEDYDLEGHEHMGRHVARLRELGADAMRFSWGEKKGDDAWDYFDQGGTSEELLEMLEMLDPASRWPDPPVDPEPAVVPHITRFSGDGGRRDRARGQLYDIVLSDLGQPARTERLGAWWCCPFHDEDTPSFKVSTLEPFYRCFGCGARGDVFTYLRVRKSLSFVDVINNLAPEPLLGACLPFVSPDLQGDTPW